jgi:hypothetical protein
MEAAANMAAATATAAWPGEGVTRRQSDRKHGRCRTGGDPQSSSKH